VSLAETFCPQVPSTRVRTAPHPRWGHPFGLASVRQTNHLINWAIAGLIVIGGLLYFFGPVVLRTDDVIAVGLVILVLIGIRLGLRRYRE
jgi:hypothetical protein